MTTKPTQRKKSYNNNTNKKTAPKPQLIKVERDTVYRIQQTQKTWRSALIYAEDKTYPRRYELYNVYRDVIIDNHLSGVMDLLSDRIKGTEFKLVDSNGDISETAMDKFEQKWFYDFLQYFNESLFYGHSLIQIDSITDGYIDSISLVDRFYVSPEKSLILDYPQTLSGFNYRKSKDYDWLIEIGKDRNLGLLYKISPYILYKKTAIQFWNEYTELFGVPFRLVRTKSNEPKDRQRLFDFMKNMGSSGFGVLNDNETLELFENQKSDAYNVYDKLIQLLNGEVSKLVLGATEGVDGASGGSEARSRTHDGQTNSKIISQLRDISFFINDLLIPQLQFLGVIEDDVIFKWVNKEKLNLTDRSEVDAKIAEKMVGVLDDEYIENTYSVKLKELQVAPNVEPNK